MFSKWLTEYFPINIFEIWWKLFVVTLCNLKRRSKYDIYFEYLFSRFKCIFTVLQNNFIYAITSTQAICMGKYSVVDIILPLDSLSPQWQRARSFLLTPVRGCGKQLTIPFLKSTFTKVYVTYYAQWFWFQSR